jgi:hypothetical protein
MVHEKYTKISDDIEKKRKIK